MLLVHGLGSLLVDRKLEFSGISTVPQAEAMAQEQTRLLMRGLGRATSVEAMLEQIAGYAYQLLDVDRVDDDPVQPLWSGHYFASSFIACRYRRAAFAARAKASLVVGS